MRFALIVHLCIALAVAATPAFAEAPRPAAEAPAAATKQPVSIALPAPKTDGPVALEKALKGRRSVRKFGPKALSLEDLSQLCWAAQGVTDEKGHRTAPSAYATYPLELYVLAGKVDGLAPGVYRYLPAEHRLVRLLAGDQRAAFVDAAAPQNAWSEGAPALFVLTGTPARFKRGAKEDAEHYTWIEAGLVAQNLFLEVTARGYQGTYIAGFHEAELAKFLGLPAGERPLGLVPVGAPVSR